jgi:DMSO/TMAO reductase YedYZ molybdopterin-dependent catalytic subunit
MISLKIKRALRHLLNSFMLLTFLVSAITGIIKFPELQRYFIFIYNYITASTLSELHDYSGLALLILIVTHLIINRKLLFPRLNDFTKKVGQSKSIKILVFAIIAVLVVAVVSATLVFMSRRPQPIVLSGVEIKEYQGEKLGSINDFRENSIKGTQYVDKNSYKLEITGLVSSPKSYSYDDILNLPHYQKVTTINCVEGWSVKALWEGVLVKDILKNITIKPEAKTIIFYAADGYSTSFPLDYILNNNIIMASKINGVVLPPERGFPFQLVAEQKWGYKWIKWITKIELSSDTNYKGFWESRGYNNAGDLNASKYAN